MMEKISVATFRERVVSFREKIGTRLNPEQYHNTFKMLTLSYLNVDQNDSEWDQAARLYVVTAQEYVRRMTLILAELRFAKIPTAQQELPLRGILVRGIEV